MTQPGYVNSMMMPNFQPSAGFMPMNANSEWTGQLVFPQMPQQNQQAPGFKQSQIQPGFQNQGLVLVFLSDAANYPQAHGSIVVALHLVVFRVSRFHRDRRCFET